MASILSLLLYPQSSGYPSNDSNLRLEYTAFLNRIYTRTSLSLRLRRGIDTILLFGPDSGCPNWGSLIFGLIPETICSGVIVGPVSELGTSAIA